MPPVLSKGGAGSKLSATEPVSVWPPSPETSWESQSQISHADKANTDTAH